LGIYSTTSVYGIGSELPVSLTLIEGKQCIKVSSISKIRSFFEDEGSLIHFEGFSGIDIDFVYKRPYKQAIT